MADTGASHRQCPPLGFKSVQLHLGGWFLTQTPCVFKNSHKHLTLRREQCTSLGFCSGLCSIGTWGGVAWPLHSHSGTPDLCPGHCIPWPLCLCSCGRPGRGPLKAPGALDEMLTCEQGPHQQEHGQQGSPSTRAFNPSACKGQTCHRNTTSFSFVF